MYRESAFISISFANNPAFIEPFFSFSLSSLTVIVTLTLALGVKKHSSPQAIAEQVISVTQSPQTSPMEQTFSVRCSVVLVTLNKLTD
ncbi:hypothetical protein BAZSYMA_ACONTIG03627_14 [Bathymodiolus azoricus thioautotrophic gill symbiont]|uniref:Uncharacterized protein n=1 Tax=Bathymodiolus azoricus thioautotrophic gill symbiont TaxID=235205 RepID=A0A1H6K6Y4_9GAMM|nr:hypothetical protein BAZSYMA_ACONTIG03627_14 [Bathymodiolus azoricus thioautotrophic gill symbiont]